MDSPAEAPSLIARLRQRSAALQAEAVAMRRRVPPVDMAWTTFEHDRTVSGNLIAGAVAFRLFVYLLPLYLLVLLATGVVFSIDESAPRDLSEKAGVSSYLAGTIADASERSNQSIWILAPVTLYALASAGLAAHRTVATGHARAWEIPVPKARALVAVPAFLLFTIACITVSFASARLREDIFSPLVGLGSAAAYFALALVAQRALPRAPGTTLRDLVPGALLVAVGTVGLYWFNVLYLNKKVQSASEAYGALGIAATGLLWLYLIGRVLIAAPVLNATLWKRGDRSPAPHTPSS